MKKSRKKRRIYRLVSIGDTVFAPCAKDVYRKAIVVDTQEKNDNIALRIQFDTGAVHFISAELCYRVINGVAIPIEKPRTKLQKFIVWVLRKLGLSEM
ncbi:hypothetical protein [Acetivibrio cellulolyticus]|uniref:hypothetical protein n=1 Tax=Acetivibrio cellulolyticus TaxID=35830 RepID=UPI0002481C46|nr:hypothetical protein [Acetivibrio cellulolyticus]